MITVLNAPSSERLFDITVLNAFMALHTRRDGNELNFTKKWLNISSRSKNRTETLFRKTKNENNEKNELTLSLAYVC